MTGVEPVTNFDVNVRPSGDLIGVVIWGLVRHVFKPYSGTVTSSLLLTAVRCSGAVSLGFPHALVRYSNSGKEDAAASWNA